MKSASLGARLSTAFEFPQDGTAAFANRWIAGILAYVYGVVPATIALLAIRLADRNGYGAGAVARLLRFQRDGGDDEEVTQLIAMSGQYGIYGLGRRNLYLGFESLADLLGIASRLEFAQNLFAHAAQGVPVF